MPEVKFTSVVTFSSEDPNFKAENLITSSSKVRKWRSLTEGEPQLIAVLQMEKPVQIQSVDIGNDGSAFVEIQVGRKGSLKNDDFQVLLGAASFLTPVESRNSQNLNRVRMFGPDKFNTEIVKQNWDQVKIVCSQPFNKHVKYGLSFVKVHAIESDARERSLVNLSNPGIQLGRFKLRDENEEDTLMVPASAGGLFASRRQQNTETASSVAAILKSETTLASLALSQDLSKNHRPTENLLSSAKKRPKPETGNTSSFYQLKKNNIKKRKMEDEILPRRDGIPGENLRPARGSSKEKDLFNNHAKPKTTAKQVKEAKPTIESKLYAKESRPLNKLFEGVVFAMSGYQNPLRGQIREIALAMGAKYRPDWDSSCTHLVCAFPNTPKFREVKSQGGKIIKKEWFEIAKKEKKRYPWRRYCLDPSDSGVESDSEVWAAEIVSPSSNQLVTEEDQEFDTDEELEKIKVDRKDFTPIPNNSNNLLSRSSPTTSTLVRKASENSSLKSDIFSQATPESSPLRNLSSQDIDSEEAYNAETDLDEDDEKSTSIIKPSQRDSESTNKNKSGIFEGMSFLLYGPLDPEERQKLNKMIVSEKGQVLAFGKSNNIDFVISREKWNRNFNSTIKRLPEVQFVKPEFIFTCVKLSKVVEPGELKIRN